MAVGVWMVLVVRFYTLNLVAFSLISPTASDPPAGPALQAM
jgi:hypothetical protein